MVHALPLGSTHQLGIEDGLGRYGWETAQPEAATATIRSSKVLIAIIQFIIVVFGVLSVDLTNFFFLFITVTCFFFFLTRALEGEKGFNIFGS